MNETLTEASDHEQHSACAFYTQCLLATLQIGTHFKLSDQTISSLDILPKFKNGKPELKSSSRLNTTVYSILNACRTPSGPRLLALWLRHPLCDKELIDLRLDIVEYFVQNPELRAICYDNELRKIPDVMRIAYLMNAKNGCKIEDLVKIFRSYEAIKSICNSFKRLSQSEGAASSAPVAIQKLYAKAESSCHALEPLIRLIDDSIYVDKLDAEGHYIIKPASDNDMAKVFVELESLTSSARQQLKYVATDVGLEMDKALKLEADKDKGFAFKISRQKEQCIRDQPEYYQVTTVKKDGFRFANKALARLSAKYVSAKAEYSQLSHHVVKDIIENAIVHQSEVQDFSVIIAIFDVFIALATAAASNNYCRPILLPQTEGKLKIDSMRHPCLENQPDIDNYVPNDVMMSKDSKKFFLITGPNMGGKSTFIKGSAIAVVMAQCGSLIAADSACLSIVNGVYTRVGAGDRQTEGISTFMEEMLEMNSILTNATQDSLVIIDELGRGTSTFDGFGLSWAISKKLAEDIKCFTLFATHFHELTELESLSPLVGNLHVKAFCESDKLVMLFNIEPGVCGQSYGINVARYTNFPAHMVEMAENKLRQYEEFPGFSNKQESSDFVKEIVRELTALRN